MKLSRKDLRELATALNAKIVNVGYKLPLRCCKDVVKLGYNYGIYGWNWDAYLIDGVIYCYGYRNLIGERL